MATFRLKRTYLFALLLVAAVGLKSHATQSGHCIRAKIESNFSQRGFRPPQGILPEKGAFLVDSNILRAIVKNRDQRFDAQQPGYQGTLRELEKRTGLSRAKLLDPQTEHPYLWVTEQVSHEYGEWPSAPPAPKGMFQARTVVSRDDPGFQHILQQLELAGVGGPRGESDRIIVAEAFFAATQNGAVPTFLTMDRRVYNNLCRLSPACEAMLTQGSPYVTFPKGFLVKLRDADKQVRTLRVVAMPPK